MEIGGYFGLEEFSGNEYYSNLIALNTGRNALAYLIRAREIKKIFIPSFLCDSIYKVCEREGCDYSFYEVGRDFQPIFNRSLNDNEWLYVVNYYGQITNEVELKKKYGNIILDNVQAFFQKPHKGIDTIYSCRKYFGVPDGSYLASDCDEITLPVDISNSRMTHLLGRYEENASKYYISFNDNDESFYELELRYMSKLTHNILRAVKYEDVKRKREENFNYLHNKLKKYNKLIINNPVGPYMYPFYYANSLELKAKLVKNNIYIPTLWPNTLKIEGVAMEYSQNILPIPVDQRYGLDQMNIVIEEIVDYMKYGGFK